MSILYVVATPIGHLGDISQRAIEVLSTVDIIAAEDTRHSKRLLQHLLISTKMLSLHEHNEKFRAQALLDYLADGKSVALISDAGTPIVSDPGALLVRIVQDAGFQVVPVPGASAVITALSAAGIQGSEFTFVGFLPAKSSARQKQLQALQAEQRLLIFYEAPHRINAMLADIQQVFGECTEVVVARELTKKFETIRRGQVAALLAWVREDPNQQKGEFVVLVNPEKKAVDNEQEAVRVLTLLLVELSLKQAVSLAVKITGKSKSKLYQLALEIKAEAEHAGDDII